MRPLVYLTGASSGIGAALARQYHQQGWRLALVARRREALAALVAELGAHDAWIASADVQDRAATMAAGRACIAECGLPDVVIANAGISVGVDTAEAADIDVMAEVFATNTLGMAATFQPFLAPMRLRAAGTLVGVTSVAGVRGLPGHGAYCGSKAAANAYLESLRGECRGSGVRVVTLVPGYVATPLTAGNRYAMPFLMAPEAFAKRATRAIARGDSWRVIPWPMGVVAALMRVLPNALFDRLAAGRGRKSRRLQ